MPYITTDDNTELFVKDWGKGRPVVLLHGWPLSSDTFDDLAMAIANAGMRAISYDRRGFGRSGQPWAGYDYNTLADDLATVIEVSDASDATLVGFSMGGGEVARYLSRHGTARVRQAVLIASVVPYMLKTPDNPNGVPGEVFEKMAQAISEDRAKFWASFAKDFYGVGLVSHPVSDEVVEWTRDLAMKAGLKATLACANSFATTDFRADLAAFTVPTLIIHGSGDKTVPIDASARAAAAGIRGATLLEYDGAPHGLLASHKAQLALDVLRFLRG
ncbi:MAG: alpha/beta hydrolase [Pseudomonadota bacterium]|nr:alpha/beta hydrolase [Pseudomonadota bacterium]